MKTRRFLCKADLDPFVLDLLNSGIRVIAPVRIKEEGREFLSYRRVHNSDEIILEGLIPAQSLKEAIFPPTEALFGWKISKSLVSIQERPEFFEETVVIGASPCDAASLEIVDHVMGWGCRDELWFGRRAATTILAVACTQCDDACFCAAMGLSPESTRGADWFLTPTSGGFNIEVLTTKGIQLLQRQESRLTEPMADSESNSDRCSKVQENLTIELEKIQHWLERSFKDSIWKEMALRCHGCGTCTYVCPTCHCFDIADEPEGTDQGSRRRNWDTCQTGRFTLQASGHNPRRDQTARFRQRITHKFSTYPLRFGEVLCTGCGRCIRSCAAGVDLISILRDIDGRAGKSGGAR